MKALYGKGAGRNLRLARVNLQTKLATDALNQKIAEYTSQRLALRLILLQRHRPRMHHHNDRPQGQVPVTGQAASGSALRPVRRQVITITREETGGNFNYVVTSGEGVGCIEPVQTPTSMLYWENKNGCLKPKWSSTLPFSAPNMLLQSVVVSISPCGLKKIWAHTSFTTPDEKEKGNGCRWFWGCQLVKSPVRDHLRSHIHSHLGSRPWCYPCSYPHGRPDHKTSLSSRSFGQLHSFIPSR